MANLFKKTFKISIKSGPSFALTIKNEKLILAPFSHTNESQLWIKESISPPVQDPKGVLSFALINKYTGQAIKRSAQDQPLLLIPYDPKVIDVTLFWSEAPDSSNDYKSIRTILDTSLCFDAQNAESNVQDGTSVVLWPSNKQNNQLWKFEEFSSPKPTFRFFSKLDSRFSLTPSNGTVVLADPNKNDDKQHWYKIDNDKVKDAHGLPTFSLINKATRQVIKSPDAGYLELVQLVPYDTANLSGDTSLMLSHAKSGEYGIIYPTNSSRNRHFQIRTGRAWANAQVEIHHEAPKNLDYERSLVFHNTNHTCLWFGYAGVGWNGITCLRLEIFKSYNVFL